MKLYHGTSLGAAEAAWKIGLLPRNKTKRSNWDVQSRADAVYLTTAYPLYFSANARAADGSNLAVLEIDTLLLDEGNLVPDEDVLEQAGRERDNVTGDMKKRTAFYRKRLQLYRDGQWIQSVKAMGTCAHLGAIPAEAITRLAVVDTAKQKELLWRSMDPSITLINYALCGYGYRAMVAWMFGDPLPEQEGGFKSQLGANDVEWLSRLSRDGIEIKTR